MIENTLQQQDDHDSVVHSDNQARKPSKKIPKNHHVIDIIGDLEASVWTRGVPRVNCRDMMGLSLGWYTSTIEPKNYKEALNDEFLIQAMQEELSQFESNETWDLVPKPQHANKIGTKWIFKNKTDEKENTTRKKAHLVA